MYLVLEIALNPIHSYDIEHTIILKEHYFIPNIIFVIHKTSMDWLWDGGKLLIIKSHHQVALSLS